MNDYPRCETCDHWDTEDKWSEEGAMLREPYGQCQAYIPELSHGHGRHTKPDFGCIHHSDLENDR